MNMVLMHAREARRLSEAATAPIKEILNLVEQFARQGKTGFIYSSMPVSSETWKDLEMLGYTLVKLDGGRVNVEW